MMMKKKYHRADRVSEEILKEVSNIIRNDMKDPRLGFVSVTRVELSRDLRSANVYVSVMGSREEKEKSMAALRSGSGFIRGLIGRRLGLRVVPDVNVRLDDSIERGARISEILKKVLPENGPEKKP